MGCLDESSIIAHIDAIDAKLAIFYGTPEKMFDYKVGGVSVSKSEAVKTLLAMKKQFLDLLDKLGDLSPVEHIDSYDYLHDRFGQFVGTMVGDET